MTVGRTAVYSSTESLQPHFKVDGGMKLPPFDTAYNRVMATQKIARWQCFFSTCCTRTGPTSAQAVASLFMIMAGE